MSSASISSAVAPSPIQLYAPWEQRHELGFLKAYGLTVKEVVLHPQQFFQKYQPGGPNRADFLFFLITSVFPLAIAAFLSGLFYLSVYFQFSNSKNPVSSLGLGLGLIFLYAMAALLVAFPIIYVFLKIFTWLYHHLFLRPIGKTQAPAKNTFHVEIYAMPVLWFSGFIPVIGIFVALAYRLIFIITGHAAANSISPKRALLSLLAAFGGICVLVLIPIFIVVMIVMLQ